MERELGQGLFRFTPFGRKTQAIYFVLSSNIATEEFIAVANGERPQSRIQIVRIGFSSND